MRHQLRIYRALLKLYPRSFRDRYGEEMVMTLEDMLAGQPNKLSRLAVWLRVSAELPFSIVHETSNNIGEKSMTNLAFTNNKRLLGAGAVVAAIILVAVFRVWFYDTAVPNTVGVFYRNGLTDTLNAQNKAIGDPYNSIAGEPLQSTYTCGMLPASGIRVELDCQVAASKYIVLGQQPADKEIIMTAVSRITDKLRQEGYKDGGNGVTLSSLVAGTYEDKDYSPDAYYEKTIGDTTCTFDTFIAYSNPKPAAIDLRMRCERRVSLF